MNITIAEPIGLTTEKLDRFKNHLEEHGHALSFFNTRPDSNTELLERIKAADVVIISNLPLPGEVIRQCPALKFINIAFTGTDHVDKTACKELGITVCNAAGYSTNAVAELAISSAISLLRKTVEMERNLRSGLDRKGFLGGELSGKTVGIVGLGAIGERVAALALAFGCKVLAYNRSKKNIPGVSQVSLSRLLVESDIVSLHVPLNSETTGMINSESFQMMKPSALLINTARGNVVDIPALAAALKAGTITGAAIDVYEKEPPLEKAHPMMDAPNTILLPHIGFATNEAIDIRSEIIIENTVGWLNGKPMNVV
ncbi:NAD(P)-dependent oxidoreductase [Williamwhitmania taraxaci]|uniref:D-3-phosphoglycerate dehydrogenase n=1 Tax=Williamwhitmania taraxaci TaxID=1640674 RepID=A0A1G6H8R6_9BACT|nr:NAD(P)-dependent oxidoreductase [Williamwhitmania taraxaci]SDB90679.1 D-3-phosphoglycerate dehydrogenase [Williamwhitmania taraxaci]